MYYCCGITEVGIMPHNEDAMLIHRMVSTEGTMQQMLPAPFLAAVCDGVSGEQAGELASRTCLNRLSALRYSKKINLKRRILEIHREIAEQSRKNRQTANMQTTLCGIAIDEDSVMRCFNVGDSRIYRYRNGGLEQLSRDQTLVQMLYDEGSITSEEKRVHSHRNIILPVIGNLEEEPKPEVFVYPDGMRYGDLLLLCSDGLTDYVTNYEIEEVLARPKAMPIRLAQLVQLALDKGGRDNITLIGVVRYPQGVPLPFPPSAHGG